MRMYRQRLGKIKSQRKAKNIDDIQTSKPSSLINTTIATPRKESLECITLMKWAHYQSVVVKGEQRRIKKFLIHIPNGGSRHKVPYFCKRENKTKYYSPEGKSLKAQGVTEGVSDYFLALPVGKFSGLWLEMKRDAPGAKLSQEQEEWLDLMDSVGFKVGAAKGWQAGAKQICEYLGIEFKG